MPKIYFHVDVNSAFLSWSALKSLQDGGTVDLRTIPAVVGGDEAKRHGVVLAKSAPAKKFGIQTGESLFAARAKCPGLTIVPPDFDFYVKNSKALIAILNDYTPDVEQYSIDEAFLDMTGTEALFGPPLTAAHTIRRRVRRELGFTVNVGIAPNRLLAKMASDFEKPDKVHTLYRYEVEKKMWPLPVGDLFGVGPSAAKRLNGCGVYTIGDFAKLDRETAVGLFGTRGDTLWNYANGRESDPVTKQGSRDNSYGNSVTMPSDLARPEDADATMLALCDSVGRRLRAVWLPAVLPAFRQGCSVALGICWKSGVAAEVIGLPNGSIGDALYRAKITLSTGELFAWTFVIILLSAAFEKLFLRALDAVSRALIGGEEDAAC